MTALTQPSVQWTADGPIMACALQVAGTGLSPELAVTLHLRMAARLALGMRLDYATYKHVRVYLVGSDWVLLEGCDQCSIAWGWCDQSHEYVCTHNPIHEKSHVRTQPTVVFTH